VQAADGKPVLFFPARFDILEAQPIDGYAYWLAVQCYNLDTGRSVPAIVSTDAQGAWWGGRGRGTIPHALIAAFLGDTAEATVAFARYLPVDVPRVALVDFNNNTPQDAGRTLTAFWRHYREGLRAGDTEVMQRWTLDGVRLDTSLNVRDFSLGPDDPYGVNPVLVRRVRQALDQAWQAWDVSGAEADAARDYCRRVKVYVTGGFNAERIRQYERDGVPVDAYGVGSTLLRNDSTTNTDYTMDIVRLQLGGQWVDMAKIGRRPNDNPDLQPVDLSGL
jgi:nicotinate phosphoribosyltransferase